MEATTNDRGFPTSIAVRWLSAAALMSLLVACSNQPSPIQGSGVNAPSGGVLSIGVVANTVGALPKCSSSLYGTTAYVQSPISLYTCQAGTWVPVLCLTVGAGAVAYASASQTLLACVSGQWTPIPLPAGN